MTVLQEFKCRVYTDGRLCLQPEVLRAYADLAGRKVLPKSVWMTETPAAVILTWGSAPGGKRYDLSIRSRLLFGRFPSGKHVNVIVNPNGIHVPVAMDGIVGASPRVSAPPKAKTPKVQGSLVAKLQVEFKRRMRDYTVQMLQTEFSDATLAQLVAVMPDLTVGELLNRT